MSESNILIFSPLLISAILILSIDLKKMLAANPSTPLLSIEAVKNQVVKASAYDMQEYGRLLKSDIEIYVGFFLIACIFIGRTNMIGVFSFWQMMRVRYMMSVQTQMAFSRLDQSTQVYL
jgi:hypothetical protein